MSDITRLIDAAHRGDPSAAAELLPLLYAELRALAEARLIGSWSANTLPKSAVVEGITVWGNDVWIVDASSDMVYRYTNVASRTSGSQNAASTFALHADNISPKDLVTDGTHFWVVDDQTLDRVYKYKLDGTYVTRWAIDPANASPTGITLDPANPRHLWIVDNGTDRVYQYDNAVGLSSGTNFASTSYPLAAGNTNPQGIADPPAREEKGPFVGSNSINVSVTGTFSGGYDFAPVGSTARRSDDSAGSLANRVSVVKTVTAENFDWTEDVRRGRGRHWLGCCHRPNRSGLPDRQRPGDDRLRPESARHVRSEQHRRRPVPCQVAAELTGTSSVRRPR